MHVARAPRLAFAAGIGQSTASTPDLAELSARCESFTHSHLKTIASFSKPEDAHLLRMRLGAGGVEAYVQNENIFQTEGFGVRGGGGVLVQVAEEDLEAAREILAMPPFEGEPTEEPRDA